MLRAILIDDEQPALRELDYLLHNFEDLGIIGSFTNPVLALEEIKAKKPDVVFLDINMPQYHGINLARDIARWSPDTKLVFTTAYDSYALNAFEVSALDYLLKPISRERLTKTIHRLIKVDRKAGEELGKQLLIKCFGEFRVCWENQEPIKWRTKKTKELFAFLVANCGEIVSKYQIIEAVWPDVNPDNAEHQLHNGIYYIRKNLCEYGIQKEHLDLSQKYCLSLSDAHYDVALVNEYIDKSIDTLPIEILQKIEEEYTGDYFEFDDWQWAEFDRYRYSRFYNKVAYHLSDLYLSSSEFDNAEKLLHKLMRINPYDEQPILTQVKIFERTNRKILAKKLIINYCTLLKTDLDEAPSALIKKTFRGLERL